MRDDARFEKAFVGELKATFEQEAKFLGAIASLYRAPYRCGQCAQGLTVETDWKPKIALVGNAQGVYRVVVDLLCGHCAQLFGQEDVMRPGYGTDGIG